MKALVVYESMFGNTRHIAEAIAEGLRPSITTELVRARDAGDIDLDDVRLVVVGAPTHEHGLSREHTRDQRCSTQAGTPIASSTRRLPEPVSANGCMGSHRITAAAASPSTPGSTSR